MELDNGGFLRAQLTNRPVNRGLANLATDRRTQMPGGVICGSPRELDWAFVASRRGFILALVILNGIRFRGFHGFWEKILTTHKFVIAWKHRDSAQSGNE